MRLMLIAWLVCLTFAILAICERQFSKRVRAVLIGIVTVIFTILFIAGCFVVGELGI